MAEVKDAENSLVSATLEKLQNYNDLLKGGTSIPFWDVVVVTAGDEEQKKSFEQQVEIKKQRREIPTGVKYLVFADPPGHKIGNGGATMHALAELESTIAREELEKLKVMLVHAGGYSQRLPNVSVVGKIFMALPTGDPMFQMFEALLMMHIDFPARMNPGVYQTSSDVIFLYNGAGEWGFTEPGITAVGHPASLKLATNHGVYVLEDVSGTWQKYVQTPSCPTVMSGVRWFLHKSTPEKMREAGAVIPGAERERVYVDHSFYLDHPTARKLSKFYSDRLPLTCEIDAFGDFLQALGTEATIEYCKNTANVSMVTDDLVDMREEVFHLMKGTKFSVVIFHEAQFNHVGTVKEYLYHLCYNQTLLRASQFRTEVMVRDVGGENSETEGCPEPKRARRSKFTDCAIMHSILHDKESISVGAGSVVEYCTLEQGVSIGANCIVSNLHVPADMEIPDSSFLHTIPLEVDGKVQYATFAFDAKDNMKAKMAKAEAGDLHYFQLKMEDAIQRLGYAAGDVGSLWPPEVSGCSLWTARLFPVFSSRLESSQHAINMIRCLKKGQAPVYTSPVGALVSLADMLKQKSTEALLSYHSELRAKLIQE